MTLIFWQNIISPHQLPYIKEICNVFPDIKVLLVVEKQMAEHRELMGWKTEAVQQRDGFKIVVNPNATQIKSLIEHNLIAQHFFSGIRANPMVLQAFKQSLNYKVKRHLIVEGPFLYKYPRVLHYFKTILTDYKYFKHISNVFAIGSHALNWYPKFGFKKHQIIPFSYCVEHVKVVKSTRNTGVIKFLFIGGLTHRKGVDLLLKSFINIKQDYILDIIGDGQERAYLETYCKANDLKNVRFLGTKDNNEIRHLIDNYDVHILPSRHDGWGAVINEALMSGLFVLCSSNCGAQQLIIDKFNGVVFSHKKKNDTYNALKYCIKNIEHIRDKKTAIKDWSTCIEGTTLAKYFVSALQTEQPITPSWKVINSNKI
ncbi:glycosyltransferase [Olleya sp. Hel_I_94]|uniref:glycosyltransferase n=1 Tax=Olleya sp. Hel_I_94 TaxID=1250001 RepID=UPI0011A22E66|nr:glycosyltransferase [Olleya sp. Hel_I_94]TVZ47788.1 glycosyltransferase involved in cell wall biosynthesis [Olleya sp. Hel_I_94]